MNFVESLDVLGIPAKEIPCLLEKSDPTTKTVGVVGLLCMNVKSGSIFKCTAVTGTEYTWEPIVGDISALQEQIAALSKDVDDLKYVAIDITKISDNVVIVEMGDEVAEVTVCWTLNKAPASQTLDGEAVDVSAREKTVPGPFSAGRSFTLVVTDERGATDSASTAISFLNGVYYGVLEDGAVIDSAAVLGLTRKLQGSKSLTFTVNAGVGQKIVYVLPTRYGTPTFKDVDTGFQAGFYLADTISFTNASGYTEAYDVWLSTNAGLGNMTVLVS